MADADRPKRRPRPIDDDDFDEVVEPSRRRRRSEIDDDEPDDSEDRRLPSLEKGQVVDLRQRQFLLNNSDCRSTLEQKWKTSLFLSKWLSYCLRQGHGFNAEQSVPAISGQRLNLVGYC